MRCWNCYHALPEGRTLCPNCRVSLPPVRSWLPELVLVAVVAAAAGLGYAVAGWHGTASGVFVGVPIGMFVIAVWHGRG